MNIPRKKKVWYGISSGKREKTSGRIPMQVHFQIPRYVCLLGFMLFIGELEALFDQKFFEKSSKMSAQFKVTKGIFGSKSL